MKGTGKRTVPAGGSRVSVGKFPAPKTNKTISKGTMPSGRSSGGSKGGIKGGDPC